MQGHTSPNFQLPLRKLDPYVLEMSRILLGSKPGSIWNRPRSLGYVPVLHPARRVGLADAISSFSRSYWSDSEQFIYLSLGLFYSMRLLLDCKGRMNMENSEFPLQTMYMKRKKPNISSSVLSWSLVFSWRVFIMDLYDAFHTSLMGFLWYLTICVGGMSRFLQNKESLGRKAWRMS